MTGPYTGSLPTPTCPECGFWVMIGYEDPQESGTLIWACKGCGSTFTYSSANRLVPYFTEIYFPACPRCGEAMLMDTTVKEGRATAWRCPGCGETISF